MYNVGKLKFRKITSSLGCITPVEENSEIPFDIKRIYYIYGVNKNAVRGHHAHRKLHQALICVSGSVKIRVKTPYEEEIYELNDPSQGLYIGPMIWREMFDFSDGAVLLVLASAYYNEEDYLRDYDYYSAEAKKLF